MVNDNELDVPYLGEIAADIESTTIKISKIINGLRTFSRESTQDPFTVAELKTIIDDTLSFCSEKFKLKGVAVSVEITAPELKLHCHPSAVSQVLLNLLSNAIDAVEILPEKWVKVSAREIENQIEITVTDSGTGISPKVFSKLFQPFFTTKEIGKGTGIGLGISKKIVENHNGKISVNTQCKNTQFVIILPKYQKAEIEGEAVA